MSALDVIMLALWVGWPLFRIAGATERIARSLAFFVTEIERRR